MKCKLTVTFPQVSITPVTALAKELVESLPAKVRDALADREADYRGQSDGVL